MKLEFKYLVAVLFILLLLAGLYLKFIYDVPDDQEVTNSYVSTFLIALGIVGVIVSLLWKKKRKPFTDASHKR
jgi:hypothetical protein